MLRTQKEVKQEKYFLILYLNHYENELFSAIDYRFFRSSVWILSIMVNYPKKKKIIDNDEFR